MTRFLAPEVIGEVSDATILCMTANWLTIWGFSQYSVVKGRGADAREVTWHATVAYVVLGMISLGLVALLGGRLTPLLNAPHAALYGPRHSTILLSHLHWDHVAGLPFFTPIYVPGQRVEIVSGPNGVMPHDQAIRSLFRAPFFPVDYAQLADQVSTRELRANEKFTIGDITITRSGMR